MTSASFHHLSELVFDAAGYLADHDHQAAGQLNNTGRLLAVLGDREAATERQAAGQPQLPGLVL